MSSLLFSRAVEAVLMRMILTLLSLSHANATMKPVLGYWRFPDSNFDVKEELKAAVDTGDRIAQAWAAELQFDAWNSRQTGHAFLHRKNVSLLVESSLSRPVSHLKRWGLQSCELTRQGRRHAEHGTTIVWRDVTVAELARNNAPIAAIRKWCHDHGVPSVVLFCFLGFLCAALIVVLAVSIKGGAPVARSHPDMPGVEFGAGSWAKAYREARGARREALKLMIECRVITPFELSNDLTVVPTSHIEECISVAEVMLRTKPHSAWVEDPSEARAMFQGRLTPRFNNALTVVEEDSFDPDPDGAAASWHKTPPKTRPPRAVWSSPSKRGLLLSPGTPLSEYASTGKPCSESPLIDCGFPCPPSPSPAP